MADETTTTLISPENQQTIIVVVAVLALASLSFNAFLLGQIRTIVGATAALELHDAKYKVQQNELAREVDALQAALGVR